VRAPAAGKTLDPSETRNDPSESFVGPGPSLPAPRGSRRRKVQQRVFALWNWRPDSSDAAMMRFRLRARSWERIVDAVMDGFGWVMESVVYAIGPILIVLALAIMGLLTYTWWTILMPMWHDKYRGASAGCRTAILALHGAVVAVLLGNILFNYWHCVLTKHKGREYDAVVRELAAATGFVYPETPDQVQMFRREFEDLMVLRMRRRQARAVEKQQKLQQVQHQGEHQHPLQGSAGPVQRRHDSSGGSATSSDGVAMSNGSFSNGSAPEGTSTDSLPAAAATPPQQPAVPAPAVAAAPPPPPLRRWMLLGPYEWGYCGNSNQPKPPRSHFDHVSRTLVLNLDHYCPWMFNSSTVKVDECICRRVHRIRASNINILYLLVASVQLATSTTGTSSASSCMCFSGWSTVRLNTTRTH
jgi:DHHC palmitoyltransferase